EIAQSVDYSIEARRRFVQELDLRINAELNEKFGQSFFAERWQSLPQCSGDETQAAFFNGERLQGKQKAARPCIRVQLRLGCDGCSRNSTQSCVLRTAHVTLVRNGGALWRMARTTHLSH